jgi:GrpB-like predicted nucleotidyltransferase (UPF0157 family)
MIIIHSYKTTWPEEFESILSSLLRIPGPLALRVDHVGSTSVPGLAAKDVIDIQVTVEALTPDVKERLVHAGYQHKPEVTQDHVPAGEEVTSSCGSGFSSLSLKASA